jgi:hypothetical protein
LVLKRITREFEEEVGVAYTGQRAAYRAMVNIKAITAQAERDLKRRLHEVSQDILSHHSAVRDMYEEGDAVADASLADADSSAMYLGTIRENIQAVCLSQRQQSSIVVGQLVGKEMEHRRRHEKLLQIVGYLHSLENRWYLENSNTFLWHRHWAAINLYPQFVLPNEVFEVVDDDE